MKKFTLLELIVVVALIGILLSLLLPSLSKAREHAKMSLCLSNQSQLGKRIFLYAKDRDYEIPPYRKAMHSGMNPYQIATGHNTRTFINTQSWKEKQIRNLAFLWNNKTEVTEDKAGTQLLFCPSQKNINFMYETYSVPAFPTCNKGFSWQTTARVRISYNYNILRDTDKVAKYKRISFFEDETILLTDLFTQSQWYSSIDQDLMSHGVINSFGYTKGDGSVKVKKSKSFIATIRSDNWEDMGGLNTIGAFLE